MANQPFHPALTDEDLLPVVDEQDRVMGVAPRRQVHLGKLRHRAVQICVLDPQGRIWLQQRGLGKDSYPGCWDFGATGHVDPGESYEDAARRELHEELGIDAEPTFILKAEASELTGWEFQSLYWLRWSGGFPDFNRGEIERMRVFTLEEILRSARDRPPEWPLTPCVAAYLPHMLRTAGLEEG